MNAKRILVSIFCSVLAHVALGQQEVNNFLFPDGTRFGKEDALGHVEKIGEGPLPIILIADVGFGWNIYKDFMEQNKMRYTMYAVTLPGSDHTPPLPLPLEGTSFGNRPWLEGVQKGILALIEKEKLKKPIIAGNLILATWVVLNTALEYPDKIDGAVVFSGMPFASWPSYKDPSGKTPVSFEERAPGIDNFLAPKMYKKMQKEIWDKNLYQPPQYSTDSILGQQLYASSASTPIAVMARYLCEFYTTDVSRDLPSVKLPVLVLVPGFDEDYLAKYERFRDKQYFWQGWEKAKQNDKFQIEVIPNARYFVWRDQSDAVNKSVAAFLKQSGR